MILSLCFRSGTFCLVDSALIQIEAKKSLDVVDVQTILMHMRRFRMGLIQTFDQLRWLSFSWLLFLSWLLGVLIIE